MTTPKHSIKKVIIELDLPSQDKAHSYQQKVGNIFHHSIAEQLDRLCNKYSKTNELHRIDKLEIDLGKVSQHNFESELKRKLLAEFEAMLGGIVEDLNKQGVQNNEVRQSQLDLLANFIRTSTMPWWADLHDPNLLTNAFSKLLNNSPQSLDSIRQLLFKNDNYLLRFVSHIETDILLKYYQRIHQNIQQQTFIYSIFQKLVRIFAEERSITTTKQKQVLWFGLFKASESSTTPEGVCSNMVEYLAKQFSIPLTEMAKELHQALPLTKQNQTISPKEKVLTEQLYVLLSQQKQRKNQVQETITTKLDSLLQHITKLIEQDNTPIEVLVNAITQLLGHYKGTQTISLTDIQRKLKSISQQTTQSSLPHHSETTTRTPLPHIVNTEVYIQELITLLMQGVSRNTTFIANYFNDATPSLQNTIWETLIAVLQTTFNSAIKTNFDTKVTDYKLQTTESISEAVRSIHLSVPDIELLLKKALQPLALQSTFLFLKKTFILEFISLVEKELPHSVTKTTKKAIAAQVKSQNHNNEEAKTKGKQTEVGKQHQATLKRKTHDLENKEEIKIQEKQTRVIEKQRQKIVTLLRKTTLKIIAENKLKTKIKAQDRENANKEEEIFITNAGLAILAPYIKYLFIALEYMEENSFVSEELQHRAVQLLHHICLPEELLSEYNMPFLKVLCGLEPYNFIETNFIPTEREKSESESLLKIIIERAEVFKSLSNEGFRSSFLMRDAKLARSGKHWLLQVEKKTHDILLDKIPWNYKLIRLPWMKSMIQVDW